MGQFSVKTSGLPGSHLSGNQHQSNREIQKFMKNQACVEFRAISAHYIMFDWTGSGSWKGFDGAAKSK